jgi:chromosome partitioning protein
LDRTPVFVIAQAKGGCSKTSLSLNIGGALSSEGQKVLLVDLDPQGNLSKSFEIPEATGTALDVFVGKEVQPFEVRKNLLVLPFHRDLSGLVPRMATDMELLFRLKEFLSQSQAFDFVILDTPPTLTGLTLSAFAAATHLIVALSTNFYTVHGTKDLLGLYTMVKKHINPGLVFLGAAIGIHDRRATLSKEIAAMFSKDFEGKVFRIAIPRSIKVEEAQTMKKPVVDAFPGSDIAALYKELASEIQTRLDLESNTKGGRP